ncbi:cell division protein FtsQ/DivIB [Marinisporobacter balticus]|uniref:Cell division protein FtsQ n=1 Tax=Marinisporobacter balticus TaxID=2018667 RepID=A0A4V2SCH4_9FIRM|nr:FtsQ-type POTRA domain-containing protein [Marinisporobacter balticus]TCO79300.1 cell division protein FtsQ [Marinisporobacter balticus]
MNGLNQSINKNIKRKKNIFVCLMMLLIGVISFIIIFKTDVFTVKYVDILGNKNISKEELLADSGIVLGNHIFKEKVNNIQLNLYRNSYIKTVLVKRKLPNRIIIQVTERIEEAAIPFMNEFLMIDEEGMVLRSSASNELLKIIEGLECSNFMEGTILRAKDKDQLSKSLEIVRKINENEITIKELDITNKENIIIKLTDDLICKIGEGEIVEYELQILKQILEDLKKKNITRGIIDISNEGYPSYRPVE